ncbi:hypothetical protein J6590_019102 [Homalodisca vitripennis]|nr:hypothetical protein J6590_019102 [Homalodisca vitripennis]
MNIARKTMYFRFRTGAGRYNYWDRPEISPAIARYNRDADDLDPEEVHTLHFNDRYQYESSTHPESEPEPAPAMLDLPMGDAIEIQDNYPEASMAENFRHPQIWPPFPDMSKNNRLRLNFHFLTYPDRTGSELHSLIFPDRTRFDRNS